MLDDKICDGKLKNFLFVSNVDDISCWSSWCPFNKMKPMLLKPYSILLIISRLSLPVLSE